MGNAGLRENVRRRLRLRDRCGADGTERAGARARKHNVTSVCPPPRDRWNGWNGSSGRRRDQTRGGGDFVLCITTTVRLCRHAFVCECAHNRLVAKIPEIAFARVYVVLRYYLLILFIYYYSLYELRVGMTYASNFLVLRPL